VSAALLWCIILILLIAFASSLYALWRIYVYLNNTDRPDSSHWTERSLEKIPLLGPFFRKTLATIAALKQSEQDHKTKYKILTENTAAAVMLHEADGTINWCSPFTEVLTGFPLSAIYRERG